jgi:hypothetical protein
MKSGDVPSPDLEAYTKSGGYTTALTQRQVSVCFSGLESKVSISGVTVHKDRYSYGVSIVIFSVELNLSNFTD